MVAACIRAETGVGPSIASGTFMGVSVATWAMMLVFMGGAGKSAMFPLTHLVTRCHGRPNTCFGFNSCCYHGCGRSLPGGPNVSAVYHFSAPDAFTIIAYVGAFTSLFAAVIACTQFDIKRVLAFSTLSQIGYMMLALGVSGYGGEEGLGFHGFHVPFVHPCHV